jgi:ABC-type sugar transport system substrate-binding protein
MKMKKILTLLIALAMVIGMGACSNAAKNSNLGSDSENSSENSTADSGSGDKKIVIAIAMNNLDSWQTTVLKYYQEAAKEKGYELVYTNAGGKVDRQVTDIESLIVQKPDVIAIQALDTAALKDVAQQAYDAGIPVADVYYGLDFDKSVTVNGGSAYERGYIMGEAVIDFLRKNKDVELKAGYLWGSMTMDGAKILYNAFNDAMNEATDVKDRFEILDEQDGEWMADKAMSKTENWMQSFNDMNCIITQNNGMTVGAASAVTSAGKDMSKFFIFGDDMTKETGNLIKEGKVIAATGQNLKDTGYFVIENLAKVAKGELKSGDNAELENAYTIATKDNVDSIMDIVPD